VVFKKSSLQRNTARPCGVNHNAFAYGGNDCVFEFHQGRLFVNFFLISPIIVRKSYVDLFLIIILVKFFFFVLDI